MFCTKCGSKQPDDAKFCGACGKSLGTQANDMLNTKYYDKPKSPWIQNLQDKWYNGGAISRKITGKLADRSSDYSAVSQFNGPGAMAQMNAGVSVEQLLDKGSKNECLEQIFALVRSNPQVTGTASYHEKAWRTVFYLDMEELAVNAFACAFKPKGKDDYFFGIVMFDGYANFMLAVDAVFKSRRLEKFFELGDMLKSNGYRFSQYDLGSLLSSLPSEARIFDKPYLTAFETVAHELGHICYEHVFSPGYGQQTMDQSRNMERDADSFASSVINRSVFNVDAFVSHFKCCVAWTLIEKYGGRVEPGTHPLSSERLANALKSNSEIARQLGITDDFVRHLIG